MPSAVEELLRFDSPVQFNSRCALVDAEVRGLALPAGQVVTVLQGSANRDPARFDDADRLDLGRADNVPLSSGWAAHHCLGAGLARMEGEAVFAALARRFTRIELVEEHPPWRNRLTLPGLVRLPVRVTAA